MQKLAGLITESEYKQKLNEGRGNKEFKIPTSSDPNQIYVLSGAIGYFKVKNGEWDSIGLTVPDGYSREDVITIKPRSEGEELDEGKLFEEKMSLEVDDDFIELSADSGEYDGDLNDDGTVDFSVFYDDGTEFDESNWKSILGKKHAFVKISNQIPTKVEAAGDYVMITVDLEDLKNLIKPNKSKNMKNLGSYETKDSKGNIVKRYI